MATFTGHLSNYSNRQLLRLISFAPKMNRPATFQQVCSLRSRKIEIVNPFKKNIYINNDNKIIRSDLIQCDLISVKLIGHSGHYR